MFLLLFDLKSFLKLIFSVIFCLKRLLFRDYFSCKNPPLDIFPEAQYDTPILELYVPMPLHIKLGVTNDCLRIMETFFPEQMSQFYEDFSFHRGGGPGNDFTGKTISEMIKEEKLVLLGQSLGEDGDIFIRYLAAIREMMAVCNQEQLTDYSYEEKAEEFRDAFEELQETYGLSETIKVHILGQHVPDYMARTGNFSYFLLKTFFFICNPGKIFTIDCISLFD